MQLELQQAIRRNYLLRQSQPAKKTLEVTFPFEVVEREARKRDMTVKEFISKFRVVAYYGVFEGVHYTFEEIEGAS